MTPREKILSALREGEENAVSLCEMQKIAGLDNRSTRLVIENLRREGYVIISSNKGYYFPKTLDEISHYINKESKRARSIFIQFNLLKLLKSKCLMQKIKRQFQKERVSKWLKKECFQKL